MSVMAFCAATPRICDRPNDVMACDYGGPDDDPGQTAAAFRAALSVDVIDQNLGDGREHQPARRLISISTMPARQAPAPRPDQRAGFLPGGGPANFLLLGWTQGRQDTDSNCHRAGSVSCLWRRRRLLYLTASLNSTTTVRLMMSPKMCCWMVWFPRFVAFSATPYRPSFHFVPMVRFTDVYGSV